MKLILLSCISLGRYCWKSLVKSEGFRKNIKREDGHIRGVVYKRGVQTFCTWILRGWTGGPWSPELLEEPKLEKDLIWKEGTQTPLHMMYGERALKFGLKGTCIFTCFSGGILNEWGPLCIWKSGGRYSIL